MATRRTDSEVGVKDMKTDFRRISCEDEKWKEVAQIRFECQALVLSGSATMLVRFQVLTAASMKITIFWDVIHVVW
jgi:hypothetical protein